MQTKPKDSTIFCPEKQVFFWQESNDAEVDEQVSNEKKNNPDKCNGLDSERWDNYSKSKIEGNYKDHFKLYGLLFQCTQSKPRKLMDDYINLVLRNLNFQLLRSVNDHEQVLQALQCKWRSHLLASWKTAQDIPHKNSKLNANNI